MWARLIVGPGMPRPESYDRSLETEGPFGIEGFSKAWRYRAKVASGTCRAKGPLAKTCAQFGDGHCTPRRRRKRSKFSGCTLLPSSFRFPQPSFHAAGGCQLCAKTVGYWQLACASASTCPARQSAQRKWSVGQQTPCAMSKSSKQTCRECKEWGHARASVPLIPLLQKTIHT